MLDAMKYMHLVVIWGFLVFIIGIMFFFVSVQVVHGSCSKIGMEYVSFAGLDYCLDKSGYAHPVHFDCAYHNSIFPDCMPRIMELGGGG